MDDKQEKDKKEKEYDYSDFFNNTIGIQIVGIEKLLNEKISNLKERIEKLENNELKRDDRRFQWKILIVGAIFGVALTIIIQSLIKIAINKIL